MSPSKVWSSNAPASRFGDLTTAKSQGAVGPFEIAGFRGQTAGHVVRISGKCLAVESIVEYSTLHDVELSPMRSMTIEVELPSEQLARTCP